MFCYGGFNFKRYLAQIGVSHGQRVSWLWETLVQGSKEDSFCKHENNEQVNLAFPGLLVRLADIMDFDASRAPTILYRHFGIENAVSILEWNKHMAITGWLLSDNKLTYEANACQHPVYEKAIRDFVSAIKREVESIYDQLIWQRAKMLGRGEHYQLRLPRLVESSIQPARDDQNREIYVFHDLRFELDHYEIQQLLMGESLYGDPTLCLRELLQNALDALQMRDLRLKVLAKDPDARVEPTDVLRPGEALQVKVTWGRDSATDREYIRVSDSGCGMTREVLERYFTKLGKSYYRSPEYERERQILREHGFIVSPISQFGIGFLSCFMLADEIRIRTRPGHATKYRPAYDVRLSGSGSLFWLSPGTLERQGTEITLYLKPPFRLDFDRERDICWLKTYFQYSERRDKAQEEWQALEQQKQIDPFWIMSRYVIWPLFPILLNPEGNDSYAIRLDDRFHADVLAPIDIGEVIKKAGEWGFSVSALGKPRWECLDWQDDQSDGATGTRIRLLFPYHQSIGNSVLPLDPSPNSPLMRAHELAVFVEDTLKNMSRNHMMNRVLLTVNGIDVYDLTICIEILPVASGVGTKLWIDLRGSAAPRLTADRKTALAREDMDSWPRVFRGVFQRWRDRLQAWLDQHPSQFIVGLLSAIVIEPKWRLQAPVTPRLFRWKLSDTNHSAEWKGRWLTESLIQESGWSRLAFEIDNNFYFELARALIGVSGDSNLQHVSSTHHRLLIRFPSDSRDSRIKIAVRNSGRYLRDRHNFALYEEPDDPMYLARTFESSLKSQDFIFWQVSLALHLLPEAFADDLIHSFPALGICGLRGRASDGWLVAPGWIEWDVDPMTAEIQRDSFKEQWSQPLIEKSYDLIFPLTHIPLGHLRRDCPKWRSDRSFRALGVLAYFDLNSEEELKKQSQKFLDLFNVPSIHALMPKPELWLKPFDDWTETDWKTCGLSALWDIESGVVYWAEGAHKADDMKRVGKPIKQFIDSKKKRR